MKHFLILGEMNRNT